MDERRWRREGKEVKEVIFGDWCKRRRWKSEERNKSVDYDWISVNRGRKQSLVFNNKELITLFVDNIPEEANAAWLSKTFTNYGIVKETYLPAKRSNRGSRFGFVRYDCPISASMAIAKASGMQVGDNKLFVKTASFNSKLKRDNGNHMRSANNIAESSYKGTPSWKKAESKHLAFENSYAHATIDKGRSFAQAVSCPESHFLPTKSIKIQQSTNGWLHRSAIAILRRRMSSEFLAKELKREESQISEVRSMGGRFILITFLSSDARDKSIKENWWQLWFESLYPWNGEAAGKERFVWLSCTGVPLNAWDLSTFKKIGEIWGTFMELDESTIKLLSFEKGRILIATPNPHKIVDKIHLDINHQKYVIDIIEEEWDSTPLLLHKVNDDVPAPYKGPSAKDLGSHNAMMEEFLNLHGECKEHAKGKHGTSFAKATNSNELVNSKEGTMMDNNWEDSSDSLIPDSVDHLGLDLVPFSRPAQMDVGSDLSESQSNIGASNSLCSQINLRPSQIKGINILVDLNPKACRRGGRDLIREGTTSFEERPKSQGLIVSSSNFQDCGSETDLVECEFVEENNKENYDENLLNQHEAYDVGRHQEGNHTDPIKATIKGIKRKKKRKTIEDILGFSKITPQNHKGRRNKQKCVVLRSAVAAAALSFSVSSDGIANRNRILLNEAQAIWEVNKTMGIGYDGDEEEVISKIAEMEAQRKERAAINV